MNIEIENVTNTSRLDYRVSMWREKRDPGIILFENVKCKINKYIEINYKKKKYIIINDEY